MNSALINPHCADTIVGIIAETMIPNNTKTPVKLIRFLLFFLLLNWTMARGLWHGRFNSSEVSISVDVTSTWFVVGWNGTRKKRWVLKVFCPIPPKISLWWRIINFEHFLQNFYCVYILSRSKFFRQPKNLTASSASSKTFVTAQKPILQNANHLYVLHKMFVTVTICK